MYGAEPVPGDLTALDTLRAAAAEADATINLAQDNQGDTAALTAAASEALQAGAGDRPYLHTGGTWAYGDADRDDAPFAPPPFLSWFVENLRRVLARGGHPVVLMPGIVYGRGGGILEPLMAGVYVGEGANHMPLVHVDDVAELYVRAVESASPGVYIAAGPDAPAMRSVAEALAPGARSVTLDELRASIGPLADALALDQRLGSVRARAELGWSPRAFSPDGLGAARRAPTDAAGAR
jgi:nucleoside-diphosphate-sugar epimerase